MNNHWLKIVIIFLACLIPLDMVGQGYNLSYYETAEIHPAKDDTTSSIPLSETSFFALHPQSESGINTTNTLSIPNVLFDSDEDSHAYDIIEVLSQKYASIYLSVSRKLEHSFIGKKLIFPFHFFL